jgi:hypothetical protein
MVVEWHWKVYLGWQGMINERGQAHIIATPENVVKKWKKLFIWTNVRVSVC